MGKQLLASLKNVAVGGMLTGFFMLMVGMTPGEWFSYIFSNPPVWLDNGWFRLALIIVGLFTIGGSYNYINLKKPTKNQQKMAFGFSAAVLILFLIGSGFYGVDQYNQRLLNEGKIIALPYTITLPRHNTVRVTTILSDISKGGVFANDEEGGIILEDESRIPVVYKTTHLLRIENSSDETLKGINLALHRHDQTQELPIFNNNKSTNIDLSPNDMAVFEVAYQYTVTPKQFLNPDKRASETSIEIPDNQFTEFYKNIKAVGHFGMLRIANDSIHGMSLFPLDEVCNWYPFATTKLKLSAKNAPSQYLIMSVDPDRNNGFNFVLSKFNNIDEWENYTPENVKITRTTVHLTANEQVAVRLTPFTEEDIERIKKRSAADSDCSEGKLKNVTR